MRLHRFPKVNRGRAVKRAGLGRCVIVSTLLVLLEFSLALCCTASELRHTTIEAFDHYVRATDERVNAELRPGSAFLWFDSLPEPQRQKLYERVRHGQLEIHQEKTEKGGKPIEIPDGSIHHWVGVVFVPGTSLKQALS